jgi:hypothetical protein
MEVFRFIDPSEVSSHRLHLVLRVAGAWATPDQFFGDPAVIFPSSTSVRFCRGANGISTVHTLRTLSLSHQAVNKERRSIADAAITDRRESVPSPRCQCACFRGRCKAFARCERSVRRKRMGPAGEDFIHLPQQL